MSRENVQRMGTAGCGDAGAWIKDGLLNGKQGVCVFAVPACPERRKP
ncbi:hypothetical protein B4135_2667 [Caldibacillus debilis]|uniref:Uncharacterized protein n=1 Tax=Caldibacillus debilis TaxID=301148 RepID=A0A150LV53_9BACI|nr:hypothetical protein B4135_2667 [Caldibacillus debilis]